MNIIPLINDFTDNFNEIFKISLSPLNLESKIKNIGDNFTLKLYEQFLNFIDDKFRNDYYKEINIKINKLTNIRYDQKLTSTHPLEYKINTTLPLFDSNKENNKLTEAPETKTSRPEQ